MRVRTSSSGLLMATVLIAACAGGSPTQAPAGATQGPGVTQGPVATTDGGGGSQPTDAPAATTTGGGGGGTGQYGSVTFHVTGPIQVDGTLDFLPPSSIFGGNAGSVLNFANSADNTAALSIIVDEAGKVVASYVSVAGQVPGADCTTSDWQIAAGNSKGKFDCTAAFTITGSGSTVAGGRITGEFTAHT